MHFELTQEELTTLVTYDTIASKYDTLAYPRWKDTTWFTFVNGLAQGSKIIDLGCGTALQEAQFVMSEGFEYFGVDISEKMLDMGRENLMSKLGMTGKNLHRMDMRQLEFADETFDGFISVTSFMHLPRNTLSVALKEASRVLKNGGRGLISVSKGDFEGMYTPEVTQLPVFVVCWQSIIFEELLQKARLTVIEAAETDSMLIYVVSKVT